MITRFKSAMDKVKAEDELIEKTEVYIRRKLAEKGNLTNVTRDKRKTKKSIAMAASLAFLLIGGSSTVYAFYQTPSAYLSVEINPSLELAVNSFGKVIKAEGYNSDAEKILTGIKVKGLNVENAVSTVVSSASKNGYISKDGSSIILFTSVTDDKRKSAELQSDAERGASEALRENNRTAVIIKDSVSFAIRDEAKMHGITAGKLNLINKLQTFDKTATIEQYQDVSIRAIVAKIIKDEDGVSDVDSDKEVESVDTISSSNDILTDTDSDGEKSTSGSTGSTDNEPVSNVDSTTNRSLNSDTSENQTNPNPQNSTDSEMNTTGSSIDSDAN